MRDYFQSWLDQAAGRRGVLACGIRPPNDRSFAVKSCHAEFPEPRAKEMLQCLSEVIQALLQNRIAMNHLCWTFENGELHCAARDDGAIAALLVSRELDVTPAVNRLFSEFLSANS